jgi:hypothetical protein
MSNERAKQKRIERKRRKREERRRLVRARVEGVPISPGRPMSEILQRFAEPWLGRLPDDVHDDDMRLVLSLAATVWNEGVVGMTTDGRALEMGREIFSALGWTESFEEAARKLRQRKAILFPDERRLFLDIDLARESGGLRVYAASATV